MSKDRISLGLALFGLAGLCGLVAWFWWPDMLGKLALWFGAASFTWKGFRAFLGKTSPSRAPTTAQPDPPARPAFCTPGADGSLRSKGPSEAPSPPSVSRDGGVRDADASPPSVQTDHGVRQAVQDAAENTLHSMRRFWVVLTLVLLVPMTLAMAIGGIVMLCKGDVPMAGVIFAVAGFLVWYCCGPLRRFWKSGEVELDDLNEVVDGTDE
ncbi:hypothetical protein [Nonomuraea helvata]|uniref:Transmembrane protein n=1 Tax=Nonomuraea helvata TaxID=37484 RepID=A0ABV5RTK7_9ACTN